MPRFIQYALAIESFLNMSGATVFLLYPDYCLLNVILPTSTFPLVDVLSVPPTTALFFQVYALLVLALTLPLVLSIPNSQHAVSDRAQIFKTLFLGEVLLIGLLLTSALSPVSRGFSTKTLVGAAGSLTPYLIWRIWALWVQPEILGEVGMADLRKEKKKT